MFSPFDFFAKKSASPQDAPSDSSDATFDLAAQAAGPSIKDLLAPPAMRINSNYMQIGSRLARTLFVFTYPRYLMTNWFSPILALDKEINISMFIHPIDTPG